MNSQPQAQSNQDVTNAMVLQELKHHGTLLEKISAKQDKQGELIDDLEKHMAVTDNEIIHIKKWWTVLVGGIGFIGGAGGNRFLDALAKFFQ